MAYNLISKHKKKLKDRANKGILVGFKGDLIYRILMPSSKIIRGSNVYIIERLLLKLPYNSIKKRKDALINITRGDKVFTVLSKKNIAIRG